VERVERRPAAAAGKRLNRLFALACALALAGCAQQASFQSRDDFVTGPLFKPDAPGPHPAVVLLHACGGMTPHVARDWPKYLVGLGYVVLAVDTIGSRGYPECGRMPDRFEGQARDAYGALDYLARQPFVDAQRIAAVGFSMGAITINELIMLRPPRPAGHPEFKAFASFYGRCAALNPALMRDAPLLQIIAEKDNFASTCLLRSKTVRMESHLLPGAYHAFDQSQHTTVRPDRAGNPMLYDAAATERSQALLREFLARTLR
jgi:dienelactone hydrolase